MRSSFSCALGVVACLYSARAEADASKALAAAKDNLPANTQLIAVIDVAAIYKSSLYSKALDAVKSMDRDIPKLYEGLKLACGWDPVSVIDGIVFAGDPKNEGGVAYVQLTIDRTKASVCLEKAIAGMVAMKGGSEKVTVKQDGNYTVATSNKKNEAAYFPWVGTNVVAIAIKPDRKSVVDAWYGQKGWAKSPVAALAGKLDPKAVVAGAFATADGKGMSAWVPVTKGYGNWIVTAGKLTALMTATATDAKAAQGLADEFNKELQRDLKKDRTPASIKKIMGTVSISALGAEVTIKGWATEKDLGDALGEAFMKKKDSDSTMSDADVKDAVNKMDGFSKRMCGCKDKACADKVNDDMTKWAVDMAKKPNKDQKPSAELAKKAAEIMTRYSECMTKIMMANQPAPAPTKN